MSCNNQILIAGAGTGKTSILAQAFVDYLKFYSIHKILAITFTQKAAEEMRTRILLKMRNEKNTNCGIFSATICTFHAFCAQIISEHMGNFTLISPYKNNQLSIKIAEKTILGELDRNGVKRLIARFKINKWGEHSGNKGIAEILVSIARDIREQNIENPKLLCENGDKVQELIRKIYDSFQIFLLSTQDEIIIQKLNAFLREFNLFCANMDKSDSIWAPIFKNMKLIISDRFGNNKLRLNLNNAVSELGVYLCGFKSSFELTLVSELLDKYQKSRDVYMEQNKIFSFEDLLWKASKILSQKESRFRCVLVDEYQDCSPIQEKLVLLLGRKAELFLVGDPKQSIYGFRGANSSTIKEIPGKRAYLSTSWRSQGAIIDFVNLITSTTLPFFDKNESLHSVNLHYGRAGGILRDDWIKQLKILISEGHHKPTDFVILVRRIKSAIPIIAGLRKFDIPAKIIGGSEFYACQEISDFAAALFVLIEPDNALAKLTVMRSPFCRLSDSELIKWKDYKLPSVFNIARNKLGRERLGKIIDFLLLNSHYISGISHNDDKEQQFANIFKLKALLIDVLADYEISIRDLWNKIDQLPKEDLADQFTEQGDSVVKIMTIHQSKGLEFPIVILADLSSSIPYDMDGIMFDPVLGLAITQKGTFLEMCCPTNSSEKKSFPTPIDKIRYSKQTRSEAELYRLLYVAITRAKKYLYIIDLNQPKHGNSLMQIIKKAKQKDEILFNKLMPDGFVFGSQSFDR